MRPDTLTTIVHALAARGIGGRVLADECRAGCRTRTRDLKVDSL